MNDRIGGCCPGLEPWDCPCLQQAQTTQPQLLKPFALHSKISTFCLFSQSPILFHPSLLWFGWWDRYFCLQCLSLILFLVFQNCSLRLRTLGWERDWALECLQSSSYFPVLEQLSSALAKHAAVCFLQVLLLSVQESQEGKNHVHLRTLTLSPVSANLHVSVNKRKMQKKEQREREWISAFWKKVKANTSGGRRNCTSILKQVV